MSKFFQEIQIVVLVAIAATMLSFGMSSKIPSNDLVWEKNSLEWGQRKLSWSDFETRRIKSGVSALTASGIVYHYTCHNGEISVDIRAVFIPKESWVRMDAKTEYILAHEQLHFDITELYARRFRKRLLESDINCSNTKALDNMADEILAAWEKEQALYDRESNHSINSEQQLIWDKKIKRQLELSKDYNYSNWSKNNGMN